MKIGEVAGATGLTTKTIRFYESEGLLLDPARTGSGYRVYEPIDVERLGFILKAKRLGLSLSEIRSILYLHDVEKPTCAHVSALLDEKLSQVAKVLVELQELRDELRRLRARAGTLEDCRPSGGRICGIIEQSMAETSEETLALTESNPKSSRIHYQKGGRAPR